MLPVDICRACAQQDDNMLALSTRTTMCPNISLCDMLHELTQIDSLIELHDDNLPQYLCGDCLQKLEDAYAFVLQARQVQEQFLLKHHKGLQPQCLDETPIDIKSEADLVLEIEQTQRASPLQIDNNAASTVYASALKWQPESDTESDQANVDNNDDADFEPTQLRRSTRKPKIVSDSDNEALAADFKPVPIKRRRGRPARLTKTENGRHVCEVCGKTFSWYRDMQRHARIHFEKATYVCEICGKSFLRKDKYMFHLRSHEKREAKVHTLQLSDEWRFAERLYCSGRFKQIECKLCGFNCQRIQELREHVASHITIDTLSTLSANSDIIKEQFSNVLPQFDLVQFKQQVCADIVKGHQYLDKYCAVVNAHGYELCLSDSDEELADTTSPYQCIPCNSYFTRKYKLMQHTLEMHIQTTSTISWERCNVCQVGFVCPKLMEQHQRTQCNSQLKRYSCAKCPGKFIWLQNLKQHACSHRVLQSGEQMIQMNSQSHQIQCTLCDGQLQSMARLRAHLLTHRDGRNGIDSSRGAAFFRIYYPNGLTCSLKELSMNIANDFDVQDYGRYFNASTHNGEELDFFDSDLDFSDSEQSTSSTLYNCSLCGEVTYRLTNLLRHQQSQHNEVEATMPYVCVDCGLRFIAEPLLQQHRRRVCAKQHANYHCKCCNLRFIWQDNYARHVQLEHEKVTDAREQVFSSSPRSKRQPTSEKMQCDQCEKVFIWPKDLTRHKRIHQPQASAQYECSYCERKFYRKDGLKSHLRVHGEQQIDEKMAIATSEQQLTSLQRMPAVLMQLCRPNGCKQIQCKICLSQHTKISDLRTHLPTHQLSVEFIGERSAIESIASVSRSLYPELVTPLDKQQLIDRIQRDVSRGVELERFISITNEAGIELSLDSSETETDSDSADIGPCNNGREYICELCQLKVSRKHLLYAHQLEKHAWQQATCVCTHCQARFVSEQLLEHHYRTLCRNAQKRFLCRKCPMRFRWRDNLKLHVGVSHQELPGDQTKIGIQLNGARLLPVISYDCTECNRSFKMQKDLTRHTLMHAQDSSIYRCRWCARRFYRYANLLQHIERHGILADQLPYAETLLNASRHPHGQKCIQCKICDIRYPTISALRNHLRSVPAGTHHDIGSMLNYSITNQLGYELHLDDSETDEESKPEGIPTHYTCSMCQLRCVRKYEMHQHQQAMHRLERISEGCVQCIYKSVSSDLIAYHWRVQCGNTEKHFKCAKCNYMFMWESNLLLHMEIQHPSNEGQDKVAPPDPSTVVYQNFQCGQCPRKYNRKDRLTAHVKKCHGPGATESASTKSTKTSPAAKPQKSFLCAFCGKAVSSSSNLIIHIRRHTGEKPFKCDYCNMAFPRSSDLQCHRRTHTGERPHICTVCQKGFARSYKLQQHMRIHNGERPYKCTYCHKGFTQSNDLTLHIRRHTGERPYQCNTCGERFIQGTALKNHRLQNGHYETEETQNGKTD